MKRLVFVMLLSFACGCAFDASQQEEGDDDVGEVASAVCTENSLEPNGLWPNGIHPNGLKSKALTVQSINSAELSAIQDPGEPGHLSRMLLKYIVSCAFDPAQTFSFSWTDASLQVHDEAYPGSLALATEWSDIATELPLEKQLQVSACVAARTNYSGASVTISMRSDDDATALNASAGERSSFSSKEGAFWGNIFQATPRLYSCYDGNNRDYSRTKARKCAAGHVEGSTTSFCSIIESVGDCASVCSSATDTELGYSTCSGTQYVITTFLD